MDRKPGSTLQSTSFWASSNRKSSATKTLAEMIPKRIFAITGLISLALVFAYGLTIFVLLARTPVELEEWLRPRTRKPFSELAWRSTRFGDPDRYKMANDLVWSRRLLGKTEQQVKELLGQQSSEDHLNMRTLIGYDLVSQRQFPANCFCLPSFLFLNTDTWLLEIEVEHRTVKRVKIRST